MGDQKNYNLSFQQQPSQERGEVDSGCITNPQLARVVAYDPFCLCVPFHNEGLFLMRIWWVLSTANAAGTYITQHNINK
jgi:hypothetical protein